MKRAPRASAGPDVANAVMKGDRAALRKLLLSRADVNTPQIDGATAVHWPHSGGDSQIVARSWFA